MPSPLMQTTLIALQFPKLFQEHNFWSVSSVNSLLPFAYHFAGVH